jgi:hypothetical protein
MKMPKIFGDERGREAFAYLAVILLTLTPTLTVCPLI